MFWFRLSRAALRLAVLLWLVAGIALLPETRAEAAQEDDAPNTMSGATSDSPANRWIEKRISPSGDVDWFRFALPANRGALVTLGNLPADYTVELYNSSETKIGSSARSGITFEEVYKRLLPSGNYFVKVFGVSGANSTTPYWLMFRLLPEDVLVLSTRAQPADEEIIGELLNNTAFDADSLISVGALVYNSAGTLINAAFGFSWLDVVKPGERTPFSILVAPGDRHAVRTVFDRSTSQAIRGLAISNLSQFSSVLGLHVTGTVKNNNSFTVKFPEVAVAFYDKLGRLVDWEFDFTTPSTLSPGASASFEAIFFDPPFTGSSTPAGWLRRISAQGS